MSNYKEKYLKYKSKYLYLKKQTGGNLCDFENWIKLDTNAGQNNCGIFLHKKNPKLIMKCNEAESQITTMVNDINSKVHLFPIIYSFCKDDKNNSYCIMEKFDGDITSIFFKILPDKVLDEMSITSELKQNIKILFDLKIPRTNNVYTAEYINENLIHINELLTVELYDEFIEKLIIKWNEYFPIICKQIIKLELKLIEMGYFYYDMKFDNFAYVLSNSEIAGENGIRLFDQYFYFYCIDWKSGLTEVEPYTKQILIDLVNSKFLNMMVNGQYPISIINHNIQRDKYDIISGKYIPQNKFTPVINELTKKEYKFNIQDFIKYISSFEELIFLSEYDFAPTIEQTTDFEEKQSKIREEIRLKEEFIKQQEIKRLNEIEIQQIEWRRLRKIQIQQQQQEEEEKRKIEENKRLCYEKELVQLRLEKIELEKKHFDSLIIKGNCVKTFKIKYEARFFNRVNDIAIIDNKIIVLSCSDNFIRMYNYDGSLIKIWGGKGTDNSQFDNPGSICIKNNKIFIADTKNNRIQIFDIDGNFIKTFGNFKDNDNTFYILENIAISLDDKIFVSDYKGTIQIFDIEGNFINKFQLQPLNSTETKYFVITPDNKIVTGSDYSGKKIYTIDGTYGTYVRDIRCKGQNFTIIPNDQMIVYNSPFYKLVDYDGKKIHQWVNNCIKRPDESINVLKIDDNNVLIVASSDNIYFFK